ncbi:hypothetical protein [Vibrio mimicus]|uniref:Uncharacterized protein n=1 Tax=Vibrio mimicus VM603 TaxID=671074 RepID=D2YEZ5_VIBMI|nr:hypothetical protein [Vibrio mimicus]EEW06676.1 conserved hypothetical protein [Vibrio mimicus VM603]
MPVIKIIMVITTTVTLLIYAIYIAFTGSGYAALGLMFTAILLVWTALIGIESLWESSFSHCLKLAILTCSIANAYYTNNLSKPGYVEKNLDLFYESINIEYCSSQDQPNEEMRVLFNKNKNKLLSKCALQSHLDLQKLNIDLAKARYLDPATGAIDTIYSSLTEPDSLSCQEFAETLNRLCPNKLRL